MSNVEKEMNTIILGMFTFTVAASIITNTFGLLWQDSPSGSKKANYIPARFDTGRHWALQFFFDVISFIMLCSTFIPISLMVTIEVAKAIQGWFISNDIEMVHIEYEQDSKGEM